MNGSQCSKYSDLSKPFTFLGRHRCSCRYCGPYWNLCWMCIYHVYLCTWIAFIINQPWFFQYLCTAYLESVSHFCTPKDYRSPPKKGCRCCTCGHTEKKKSYTSIWLSGYIEPALKIPSHGDKLGFAEGKKRLTFAATHNSFSGMINGKRSAMNMTWWQNLISMTIHRHKIWKDKELQLKTLRSIRNSTKILYW